EFTEFHVELVEKQQPANQGAAFAEGKLEDFGGLNRAHDSRQHPEHAAFGAAWDHSGRRRLRIKATIARPAQMRCKDAGLPFEAEDRAIDVRLLQQHAGVIGQITRGKIISAIDHDVVFGNDFERIVAADARFVNDYFATRIDALDRLLRRFSLGPANIVRSMNDLAL